MKTFINPPFISALITGWRFAKKGYSGKPQKYIRKQQLKIVYFTLLNPGFANAWFNFLKSSKFRHVFIHRRRLYVKPFRPYISIKWDKERKVNVILDTYRFLESKGDVFRQFLTQKDGIVVAKLKFDNKYEGFIKLGYNYAIRKEGELALWLECDKLGGRITSVVFSIEEKTKGQWVCLIGCIQGHKNKAVQDAFKVMQKSLYGLRPNSLIIYSAQELIRNMGFSAIYGIGNSIHISNQKHAVNFPWKRNITFDYDNFWDEIGGRSINKDWFEIPLRPTRKNIQDIKSHKRSMYIKRYEMLDNLSQQITKLAETLN
ncbi:MAG TPA: DUF535 family protein [Bacteroidales bacterium]|nr:DUF535 family protein [Bacteroidales bacterium]